MTQNDPRTSSNAADGDHVWCLQLLPSFLPGFLLGLQERKIRNTWGQGEQKGNESKIQFSFRDRDSSTLLSFCGSLGLVYQLLFNSSISDVCFWSFSQWCKVPSRNQLCKPVSWNSYAWICLLLIDSSICSLNQPPIPGLLPPPSKASKGKKLSSERHVGEGDGDPEKAQPETLTISHDEFMTNQP